MSAEVKREVATYIRGLDDQQVWDILMDLPPDAFRRLLRQAFTLVVK